MNDDELEYIVSGALLTCSQGLVPAPFKATPRKTKISDKVAGNESDRKPIVNIPSFIICQKLTQQAGGNPVPCVPAPQPWQKTYPAKVGGARGLVFMSCLTCSAGQGKIEFLTSGQIPVSAATLASLQSARQEGLDALVQADRERQAVGESGLLEGAIPLWGSGRDFVNSVQTGSVGGAVVNGGFFIWDAVSVAAGVVSFGTATVAMQGGKAGLRAAMRAGGKVVIGAAKKRLAALAARSVALKSGLRKSLFAARKAAAELCVRACFPAGTLVLTRTGRVPIEQIQVGDEVWAYDEHSQQTDWKPVLESFTTQSQTFCEIEVVGEVIKATPGHWFFADGEWKDAADLQPGNLLLRADGAVTPVLRVTEIEATAPAYNLEVQDYHTYYVGDTGLLAHNKCDPLTELVDIGGGVLKKRLRPNDAYVRNGYKYKTDKFGRIKEASGDLYLGAGGRDNYVQRTLGKNDGRKAGDAGGHLIGQQFGGNPTNANMVPMAHKGVNEYPKGTWGSMEDRWQKALQRGDKVKVKINPVYSAGNTTSRPNSIKVTEWINGVPKRYTINNP